MNIDHMLKTLGLQANNLGTSTGQRFFGSGEVISSYSPADGNLIGSITSTTSEEYNQVIETAQQPICRGD